LLALFDHSSYSRPTRTGTDGTFRLDQLAPGLIAIRALVREKNATTNGAIVVNSRDVKGRLMITVDSKFAFRIHGAVVDRSGKPIPRAQVMLHWTCELPSEAPNRPRGSEGTSWETHSTDASGRFEFGPLFPGDLYSLRVTADGYAPFQTPEFIGTPGMSKGLGKMKLVGTGGHIAGIIVASNGKPITDATVFNRGNGLEPVQTKTDIQGRFRLDKLFTGHKYVFVRKDGYRFTGTLVEGDRDDLKISLPGSDEPPPHWKPAEGLSLVEQREFARWILLRLWAIHSQRQAGPAKEAVLTSLVLPMAQLDPAVALDWSGQLGGRLDSQVRLAGAEVLAELDAPAAIEIIKKTPEPAMALEKLLRIATWYAETDPPRALAFAQAAATQVRALDKATPIQARARAGGLLIRLGRIDEGRRLVEEAAEAFPRPTPVIKQPDMAPTNPALVATARALALFDLKRAQALVEPMQNSYYGERMKARLASSVAMTDPAQAVELVRSPGTRRSDWYDALIEVVYRCGAQRPDEALKIIERMNDDQSLSYKAEALGWLAVSSSRHQPKLAFSLIDRALTLLIDRQEAAENWRESGGADVSAARVAMCARRIGYPDMGSVLARVLAARPSGARTPFGKVNATASAALLLLLDPSVAREVLLQAETSVGSLPMPEPAESGSPLRHRATGRPPREFVVRTLVDPVHARETIDAALAEVEQISRMTPQTYALTDLAKVLASLPSRREETLWGNAWYPGRMSVFEE
jgi:hypothetical protein